MAGMAATREATVTAGRSRGAGPGIVVAGDRSLSRRLARRHSQRVRTFKLALPLSGATIIALFIISIMRTAGFGDRLPDLAISPIVPESLKMENPHYEGFNADGGRYWVKAASARQDLKKLSVIGLETITGELIDGDKRSTKLSAARGSFDSKANVLELFDTIEVTGDGGLNAKLTRATIDTKENIITSDQPVSVAMATGAITAQQLKVRQKTKEYTFSDNVRARLNPPPAVAAPQAASAGTSIVAFGDPGRPIDVTSSRLDVDDGNKTAVFAGEVVAVQGEATLSTPELTVTYVGEALAPAGASKSEKAKAQGDKDAGSKVKSITAIDPVVLKQGSNDTVTGNTATFDAIGRTAVIEGDIVMLQSPDKRAIGDRLEYDEANATMTLTGPVVVTQGSNELKGRKLVFNRATGRMQMTGTGSSGAAGRIAARFQRSASSAPAAQKDSGKASDGISFGATFKTDPTAPVQVEADRLDVDDGAKKAVFTGDVRAKQGDFFIRSAELVAGYAGSASLGATADSAKQDAAQLTRISAKKSVQITSSNGQNATGDWAEFDTKANIATLGGNVVLTQGKNVVRGTKLVIDMNTGQSTIRSDTSDKDGGPMISSSSGDGNGTAQKSSRPSAVFYPSEMKGQAAKGAGKALDGWQARTAP